MELFQRFYKSKEIERGKDYLMAYKAVLARCSAFGTETKRNVSIKKQMAA